MSFEVKFETTEMEFAVEFVKSSCEAVVDFDKVTEVYRDNIKNYDGPYNVTPKVDQQELETKDKLMDENVKIFAIPIFEVSNQSGGNTVYIAKEV